MTGVGVLRSLPSSQCGAVMAHELCHALLTLKYQVTSTRDLPPKVSEGLCELFAYLWLCDRKLQNQTQQHQHQHRESGLEGCGGGRGGGGGEAEKFLELHLSNEDPVYGGGLRAALEGYERCGRDVNKLLDHAVKHKAFPRR